MARDGTWSARIGRRTLVPALVDCAAWAGGLTTALVFRLDFPGGQVSWTALAVVVPIACALALGAGFLEGLYRGHWQIGSFEEVAALALASAGATVVLVALNLVLARPVPASVPFAGGILALGFAASVRYVWRYQRERGLRPGARAQRLLVYGAGEAGAQVVTQLLHDPSSAYLPVAVLDDDPAKRNLRIRGVPVVGGRDDLERAAAAAGANTLLVAIPNASMRLLREIVPRAEAAGLEVRAVPSLFELLDGRASVMDLRPLAESELLGREPVHIDCAAVAAAVRARRVLVTGAGGSIGTELCRQIAQLAPRELVMLDRDESGLHGTQLTLEGRALLDSPNLVVADIRDAARMREVFASVRPEVVFHAAALKHLSLLEMHPTEAIKTNVFGTLNVLHEALNAGVERFVNVSTDKAADPVSVLGYTKRLTERLTAWASTQSRGTFLSVRFGNVLGSRGSILTTFETQVAAGGPVTVTHPEVSRYFMSAEEAVQLALQASILGRAGEVLVFDMGDPVPILRLAQRIVAGAAEKTTIVFTGLRHGEKLHETMFGADETDHRPLHPRLAQVGVPPLDPHVLQRLEQCGPTQATQLLRDLCMVVGGQWEGFPDGNGSRQRDCRPGGRPKGVERAPFFAH